MKAILTLNLAWILAACSTPPAPLAPLAPLAPTGSLVEYQERHYLRQDDDVLRVESVNEVLQREAWGRCMIDLRTRELHPTADEKRPWGLPEGRVRINHSSDLWRLRVKRIGYLHLYLVRRDASGSPIRIILRQTSADIYRHNLLKLARPGDLILGIYGI